MAQRCFNNFSHFLLLLEFGQDKRHDFITIPEGSKEEGWRRFGDAIREVNSSSSNLGVENSAPMKAVNPSLTAVRWKGTFVEVLKMSSSNLGGVWRLVGRLVAGVLFWKC